MPSSRPTHRCVPSCSRSPDGVDATRSGSGPVKRRQTTPSASPALRGQPTRPRPRPATGCLAAHKNRRSVSSAALNRKSHPVGMTQCVTDGDLDGPSLLLPAGTARRGRVPPSRARRDLLDRAVTHGARYRAGSKGGTSHRLARVAPWISVASRRAPLNPSGACVSGSCVARRRGEGTTRGAHVAPSPSQCSARRHVCDGDLSNPHARPAA